MSYAVRRLLILMGIFCLGSAIYAQDPDTFLISPTGPPSIQVGDSITFSAQASGTSPFTYKWSAALSGGNSGPFGGTASTATHTFQTAGTWTISAAAVNAQGVPDSTPANITVNVQGNDVVVDITSPQSGTTFTLGSTANLSATASGGSGAPYTISWSISTPSDQIITLSGSNTSFTVQETGVYVVNCNATDVQGLGSRSPDQITVEGVNPPPPDTEIISPTGDVTIGIGDIVSFSAQAINQGTSNVSFSWNLSGPTGTETFSDRSFNYTFQTPGTFTVTCTATDDLGQSDPSPARRTIQVISPVITTITQPSVSQAMVGDSLTFRAEADGGVGQPYGYSWRIEGPIPTTTRTQESFSFPFEVAGIYTFSCSASDSAGNTDTNGASITIEVVAPEAPETYILRPVRDIEATVGESITFEAQAEGGAGQPYQFRWQIGNQTLSGATFVHVFSEPGSYLVSCTAVDAEGTADESPATRQVTVIAVDPPNTAILSPSRGIEVTVGEEVDFEATASGGQGEPYSFAWTINNSTFSSRDAFSHTFTAAGSYRIGCTATDRAGEEDPTPDTITITVVPVSLPETRIVSPIGGSVFTVNENVEFEATASGGAGQPFEFLWNVVGDDGFQQEFESDMFRFAFGRPGTYAISCIATDAQGNSDPSPAQAVISVIESELSPPDTIIVQPENNPTVERGAVLHFRAEAVFEDSTAKRENVNFFWLMSMPERNIERGFNGPDIDVVFEFSGEYIISCRAESNGLVDLSPATRTVTVSGGDREPIDTFISEPDHGDVFMLGGTIQARAEGTDNAVDFRWSVQRASTGSSREQIFNGASISFTPEEPGWYDIRCTAIDDQGHHDLTPATIAIEVTSLEVRIVQPSEPEMQIGPDQEVVFQGDIIGQAQGEPYWYFATDPQTRTEGTGFTHTFDRPGSFVLVFEAQDQNGRIVRDHVLINVVGNGHFRAEILSPAGGSKYAVNEQFSLIAEVAGVDSDTVNFEWSIAGKIFSGATVEDVIIDRSGDHPIRLFVIDPESGRHTEMRRIVRIYNPTAALEAVIREPRQDVVVPSGQTIFFEGAVFGRRGNEAVSHEWSVVNLDSGATETFTQLRNYTFGEEGSFEVRFQASTDDRESEVATRLVTVDDDYEAAFTGNEMPDNAVPIVPGHYDQVDISRPHYFRLTLSDDVQNLEIFIEGEGRLEVTLYRVQNGENQQIRGRILDGGGSFRVRALSAGEYLVLVQPNGDNSKRRLDFGVTISVLQPSLFFSEIVSDTENQTEIGIVNPAADAARMEITAFNSNGDFLESSEYEVAAYGKLSGNVEDFFSVDPTEIGWITAAADRTLVGYSYVVSIDATKAYSVTAADKLSDELYVPHIAQKVDQWFTRASVVNGNEVDTQAELESGTSQAVLDTDTGFSKDSFEFIDKLGGSLPSDAEWARFLTMDGGLNLAGTEVFGTLDGTSQTAGLALSDGASDNPNFTTIRGNIYFTHIARDTSQFWTGIALVNVTSAEQQVKVVGYGPGGVEVGSKLRTLTAGEKVVELAEAFLSDIGSPADVDWVAIETEGGVVGYELFGTTDAKRLAGHEASIAFQDEICFPFISPVGHWHGVSVINANDTEVNLTFTLYDNVGNALQTATTTLAAKAKFLDLLTNIFSLSSLPTNASWVACRADQPIAGFQLFGDSDNETMSAIEAK